MLLKSGRVARRFALGLALPCMSSCADRLDADECAALLDRYVTLLAQSDRPGTTEGELLKLQVQAREKAATDPAFERCPSEVPRRKFECAIAADTADRFEQCLL